VPSAISFGCFCEAERKIVMDNYPNSTVAAISTPSGKGGIAVIRVSGDRAIEICEKVFVPLKGTLSEKASNIAVYGNIFYRGEKIDDGIATVFRAPKSYTGEDTVEISCHGSEIGASLVLSALMENGAVAAGPGEFTKRAFLSGKLTLSQAEAVGELIDAETVAGARLSASHLSGVLGEKISSFADRITSVLTSVYAYIDYPDEDIADMSDDEMRSACSEILADMRKLSSTYDTGRAISKGIPCAIIGAPNVGKSSFLNMLTGSDRAIVTDIAGTTRDVITESAVVGNIKLLLSDTAGIRDTEDVVEKIGVERSRKELSRSELVFVLFDTSRAISEEDKNILTQLSEYRDKRIVAVLNKQDIAGYTDEYKAAVADITDHVLELSTVTESGRETLEAVLAEIFPGGDDEIRSGLILTGVRRYTSLKNAEDCLEAAIEALTVLTPDMCCSELENAVKFLLEIDGRSVNERIVDGIFAHFCVGK